MTEFPMSPDGSIEILPVHFDVPVEYIRLDTFLGTARAVDGIIAAINGELFGNVLDFELIVLPPVPGSFKSRLGIYLKSAVAVTGVLWIFLGSDIGGAFIEGLTGHQPSYYAKLAGEELRSSLVSMEKQLVESLQGPQYTEELRCKIVAKIMVAATKSFLQSDRGYLENIGIATQKFRDAYESRNEFYNTCIENPHIRGVGFDEEENFPVKRIDFHALRVDLPPKEPDLDEGRWSVGVTLLRVTSPNWARDDQARRQWKGKDERGKERLFVIDDEGFWIRAKEGSLSLHPVDSIMVQWAFQEVDGRLKKPQGPSCVGVQWSISCKPS